MSAAVEIRGDAGILELVPLSDQPMVFGRSADCDYQLDDPPVSKVHLKLWRELRVVYAKDLDSRNGTKKNGRRVASGVLVRVRDNEVVLIGTTTIKVINPFDRDDTEVLDPDPHSIDLSPEQLKVVKELARPYREEPDNPAVAPPLRREVAERAFVTQRTVSRYYDYLEVVLKLGKHNEKNRPALLASKILQIGLDLRET